MEIERTEKILNLQLEWVKAADAKVAPLFAINIAMLGLLAVLIKLLSSWTIAAAIFSSITTILLVLSMIFLALAMFPRLGGPKESNIFFGGIVKQAEEKYKISVASINDIEYQNDILSQVYRNAEIANTKYANLKLAFISTFASTLPWLIAVYILYI